MNRLVLLTTICVLALGGCAETDPYKRLDAAPTPRLTVEQAIAAYDSRWPQQFKAVHTVTLDFGPVTRTLVGYLIVQQPGRFRLQGMTEQGITLFDIADDGTGRSRVVSTVEEFDMRILEQISDVTRRIFMHRMGDHRNAAGPASAWVESGPAGTGIRVRTGSGENVLFRTALLVGDPPRVDSLRASTGPELYRIDCYDWKTFADISVPSTIVLRDRGVSPKGPPYKLTMQITEFTVRDRPWPDRVFEAKE
ncbi:MAG: hypothetical protein HS108_10445 [Planctomycetes bacterium]|nr:hypothetical protein [Planctomycetota bacterium]